MTNVASAAYLLSVIFFILGLRSLSSQKTAQKGSWLGMIGMALPIIILLRLLPTQNLFLILVAISAGAIIGIWSGLKVKLTSLPQMIAAFNGLGGLAAVIISVVKISYPSVSFLENIFGTIVGSLAFSGSLVAFAKLQGILSGKAVRFTGQKFLNVFLLLLAVIFASLSLLYHSPDYFYLLAVVVLILGFLLVLPIGGADMPVVISVLNSYSGWACVAVGFSLQNLVLIITGALVGASGSILSYVMCKAMNRSLLNVLLGGVGNKTVHQNSLSEDKIAKSGSPQDAAFLMKNANKVIIVPGYGMAVSGAQHILKTMAEDLKKDGVEVKFAIHPVAGRMPGHMNVLLAEANINYEDVFSLEDINKAFASADVAYVIGANDITNPAAKNVSDSLIYGMPILEVEQAKVVFFVKRSLAGGYAGVDNPLFYAPNTIMLYGDAKKVTEEVVQSLEN